MAEVGRYARLPAARERGLVMSSMDVAHWIARQGREYVLCVLETDRERAAAALAAYEREELARPRPIVLEPLRIPKFAVLMALLVMVACYSVQRALPEGIIEAGVADDLRIRAGEWWRAFTALTLHGDSVHVVSNLSLAIFVFAFGYGRFGTGAGTLAILLGGALGNIANAFVHVAQAHRSIGSSTALFAGLGLLTGGEIAARLARGAARAGWPLYVPIGAGMAFLSLFGGAGGQNRDGTPAPLGNVDILAHLFGLLAGILVGAAFHAAGLKAGASPRVQVLCGTLATVAMVAAWWLAVRAPLVA